MIITIEVPPGYSKWFKSMTPEELKRRLMHISELTSPDGFYSLEDGHAAWRVSISDTPIDSPTPLDATKLNEVAPIL